MLGRLCLLALFLRWAADGVGWGAVAAFSGGAPGEESCQATDFLLLDEHKRQVTDTHTNKSIIARLTTTWSSTGVGMGVWGGEGGPPSSEDCHYRCHILLLLTWRRHRPPQYSAPATLPEQTHRHAHAQTHKHATHKGTPTLQTSLRVTATTV